MLKVGAIVYGRAVDDFVDTLQRAGVLEITQAESSESAAPTAESALAERFQQVEEQLADAQFTASFLGRFHESTAPLSAFISEKIHRAVDDFEAAEPNSAFLELYERCETLAERLAASENACTRLKQLIEDLKPWMEFRLEIRRWKGTDNTALFTGTVPTSDAESTEALLHAAFDEIAIEQLGPVGNRVAWVVIAHKARLDEVRSALGLTGFTEVSFPGLTDYPAEEMRLAEAEMAALAEQEERLKAEAAELAVEHYADTVVLAERLESMRDGLAVRERFSATERTVLVTGWVAGARRDQLVAALEPLSSFADLTFSEPGPEDEPPVELANPKWLRPFETLTDLYGRPRYREVDPTPLLAGFFWVFFGMAFGDVGYGVVLIAGAWLIKTRLDIAAGARRFMDLMMLGGVSTVLFGVLTGSWFAIDPALLPDALRTLIVIDPMAQIPLELGISVAIGIVHVVFGICVRAAEDLKIGDWDAAVAGPFATLLLMSAVAITALASIGIVPAALGAPALGLGVVATFALKGRAYAAPGRPASARAWDRSLGWVWLAMLLGWVGALTLGVAAGPLGWALLTLAVVGLAVLPAVRATVLAVLLGAYETYSLSGLISDILSYTRLTALGLSGVLVGQVVNLLASMVWPMKLGPVPIGWLLGLVILLVMHSVNLAINLLGAFVHPTRLQFVEFFGKFYEGGGMSHAPFKPTTKSVVLHPAVRGQGGGTVS
jgi:V/A-type H+-transporting ATPase subunit I